MTEAEQLAEARRRLAWVYHRSRNGLFSHKRSERDAALSDINGWTADFDKYWTPSQAADPNSQWFGERP
jgi:hypothetical protein